MLHGLTARPCLLRPGERAAARPPQPTRTKLRAAAGERPPPFPCPCALYCRYPFPTLMPCTAATLSLPLCLALPPPFPCPPLVPSLPSLALPCAFHCLVASKVPKPVLPFHCRHCLDFQCLNHWCSRQLRPRPARRQPLRRWLAAARRPAPAAAILTRAAGRVRPGGGGGGGRAGAGRYRHSGHRLRVRLPLPGQRGARARARRAGLAIGERAATLLHPPLPVVGVPTGMERERQQNDRTLADG